MIRGLIGADFVRNANEIIGMNLGIDACAEHEFKSLQPLYKAFGIQGNPAHGLGSWRNSEIPNNLYFDFGDTAWVVYARHATKEHVPAYLRGPLYLHPTKAFATAWQDNAFGLHVQREHAGVVERIVEATLASNLIIMRGPPEFLLPGGLQLLDYRGIPEEELQKIERTTSSLSASLSSSSLTR